MAAGTALPYTGRIVHRTLRFALLLAPLLLAAGCGSQAPDTPQASVFVYLIDTLRPDHLGCYGYPREVSPRIDAFAADAVLFTRATSSSPWTRPSVAGLFTGLPPSLHGVRGRAGVLPQAFETWPERLSALGYRTVCCVTNVNIRPQFGFDQGFDFFRIVEEEGHPYAHSTVVQREWKPFLQVQHEGLLFHYVHTMDPHHPYRLDRAPPLAQDDLILQLSEKADPEHRAQAREDLQAYDREIAANDASFGRFLDSLREADLYEDSWIVLLSDHGEEFYEHGEFGHGYNLHENVLRVPLLIRPPGGKEGALGRELQERADRPLPLHALADLIGSRLTSRWRPLGEANAELLDLDGGEIERYVPRPGRLAPRPRTASFQLDGRGGSAREEDGLKVVWRDNPEPGWAVYDLSEDPQELAPRDPARVGPPAVDLREEIVRWWERTARGLELRYDGRATDLVFRLKPDRGLRESSLPPGSAPHRYRVQRGGTVIWGPEAGGRLLVDAAPGATWKLAPIGGALTDFGPVTEDGPLPYPGLSARRRDFGAAVFLDTEAIDPDQLPEEVLRHLQALGYID